MATAGETVKLVAAALAIPDATVSSYYRVIRDAGIIAKGGRGRSAPHLSALDTARLVITLMSAEALSEASDVTRMIASLECSYLVGVDPDDDQQEPTTGELRTLHFEDALARLLSARAPDLEVEAIPFLGDIGSESLVVRVTTSRLTAEIEVDGVSAEFQHSFEDYEVTDPNDWESMSTRERLQRRPVLEGMKTIREIDHTTVSRIASGLVSR